MTHMSTLVVDIFYCNISCHKAKQTGTPAHKQYASGCAEVFSFMGILGDKLSDWKLIIKKKFEFVEVYLKIFSNQCPFDLPTARYKCQTFSFPYGGISYEKITFDEKT